MPDTGKFNEYKQNIWPSKPGSKGEVSVDRWKSEQMQWEKFHHCDFSLKPYLLEGIRVGK